MTPLFDLDHVGIAVRSLDQAAARFRALGFTLGARGLHHAPRVAGGPAVPSGTGNHCAMFARGYLELIGVTDPAYDGSLLGALAQHEGPFLAALGTPDAEAARAALAEPPALWGQPGPLRALSRPVDEPGGVAGQAAFTLFDLPPALLPEARVFAIEHHTRDLLWQPHLTDHPNGAVGLAGCTIVCAQPAALLDRLADALDAEPAGDRVLLAVGWIEALDAETFAGRFPGAPSPAPTGLAGISIQVATLAGSLAWFAARGVAVHQQAGGFWLAPAQAFGAVLSFTDAELEVHPLRPLS